MTAKQVTIDGVHYVPVSLLGSLAKPGSGAVAHLLATAITAVRADDSVDEVGGLERWDQSFAALKQAVQAIESEACPGALLSAVPEGHSQAASAPGEGLARQPTTHKMPSVAIGALAVVAGLVTFAAGVEASFCSTYKSYVQEVGWACGDWNCPWDGTARMDPFSQRNLLEPELMERKYFAIAGCGTVLMLFAWTTASRASRTRREASRIASPA